MAQRFSSIVVEAAKLRDYCLCDTHPRGRLKARVCRSRLGLTAADSDMLQQAMLDAAANRQDDLLPSLADEFGQRYVLDFELTNATGTATVRSAWIVLAGEDVLRCSAVDQLVCAVAEGNAPTVSFRILHTGDVT